MTSLTYTLCKKIRACEISLRYLRFDKIFPYFLGERQKFIAYQNVVEQNVEIYEKKINWIITKT